ncbi:MAG TPA: rRNA maturation RNase YbeY [Anaerolineales bacterium]
MITLDNRFPMPLDTEPLGLAARLTLEQQSAAEPADLTVVLTDDEQLHQLNLDFRDVDAPTDVLSFPAGETDPETGAPYLGDVIISVERAAEQAQAGGHPLQAELQLLIVHGILHLLGHDHAGEAEEQRMWAAQAAVLAQLGLSGIKISE